MPAISPETLLKNPRLPSLPTVAVKVLELTRGERTNLREIAKVVENDQALAAKILRTVNSSYYGLSKPCSSINQAMVYLGLNAVKSLVLGFSLVESVDGGGDHDVSFDYVDYWRRSIYSAAAARLIAIHAGTCDPEEAFLGALVQDIGMIVLNRSLGDIYLQTVDIARGDHEKLTAVERHSFEVDHAMVGADLAERWNMPHRLVEVIRFHHDHAGVSRDAKELVKVIRLARMAASLSAESAADGEMMRFLREAKSSFSMDKPAVRTLLTRMAEAAKDLSWLFRIDTGGTLSIDCIMEEAEELRIQQQMNVFRENDLLRASHIAAPVMQASESFEAVLMREVNALTHGSAPVALIVCEIDSAAALAAAHGEDAAAVILGKVQGLLCLGSCSKIFRTGGAGFSLIAPRMDAYEAASLAESLRSRLAAAPISLCSGNTLTKSVAVTVSIGAAVMEAPRKGERVEAPVLVERARHALEASKCAGGNTVRVWTAAMPMSRAA
ncbi:MAG TPA: HDOD domain-containing protein [Phycisphaerales bacterium]|nr:HDOD domain-containing protein [Phycisphaerales bacterium]HRQ76388.1 HDOD domain-containing protein [Phycisphaerales bacterium]